MKTKEEINAEIATLKTLKPLTRRRSVRDAALEAARWRDDGDESPSKGWSGMTA